MTKLQAGSIVGSSEVNAAKLFLEDHKIDDIEIFPIDDAWEPEKAKSAYEEVKKRGINILITSHISTCAVAISDAINKDRALTFVTGATTDALSKKDDYILRNIQDVESEQKSIAEYISKMPQKKLLIVRDMDNYSYTTPALKYFQSAISKEKVTSFDISISKLDLNAVEQEFRKQEFDILYLLIGGYKSTSGSIAQLAKKINREVKIIFTPWMKTPTILETAGSAIKNSVMPSHYPPRAESPVVNNYIERFKNKFGYAPTFISLNVYSALQIITQAVRAGNRLPDDIKTYVLKTRKFDTEFGTVEFDQYGDTQKPLYFITDLTVEF
jgi:branched-chain amino acid transport system substrate-binding protein